MILMLEARAARLSAVIPLMVRHDVKSSLSEQLPKYCITLLIELSLSILLSIIPGAARVLANNTATIMKTFIATFFLLRFNFFSFL